MGTRGPKTKSSTKKKVWTPEMIQCKIDEMFVKYNGTATAYPARWMHSHGVKEIPLWARICHRKVFATYRREHIAKRAVDRTARKTDNPEWYKNHNREAFATYYEAHTEKCWNRTYSYLWLKRRGLLREGWHIHHLSQDTHKTFIYLPADAHRMLHSIYGQDNRKVTLEKIYNCLDCIRSFELYIDGKLVDKGE